MKNLKTGDVFYGKNYADMINNAIGTNFHSWMKSGVELDDFGCPGIIAWFVFMDGTEHGYEEGWSWVNKLSMDGQEIDEYNISISKDRLKRRRAQEGYYPYRLAFQLDPYGNGSHHCCRFVGAFRLKSFIREDASAVTYEKVMDCFKLGAKGEVGAYLNTKEDLIPTTGKYTIPLEDLEFSEGVQRLLKGYIKNAGDLLELGIGFEGPLADEIQKKICELFVEKDTPSSPRPTSPKMGTKNKRVGIDSVVEIYDFDLEEKCSFKIVTTKTGRPDELSYNCVLGKSLLGKTIGEKVVVKADEEYEVEILSIDNSQVQVEGIYRNTFFCFQGKQYENEVEGGYIFAGANHNIPHWDRLREVKVGDVIFHCYRQYIVALSIVTRECRIEKRPIEHYLATDIPDMEGYMVKMKYVKLQRPLAVFRYKSEIIQIQGDHTGKGYPFNKNGEGNQGYLFNLNKKLAKFFTEKIVKYNPFMGEKDYVQDLLK